MVQFPQNIKMEDTMEKLIVTIFINVLKEAEEPIFEWLEEQAEATDSIVDDYLVGKLREFVREL